MIRFGECPTDESTHPLDTPLLCGDELEEVLRVTPFVAFHMSFHDCESEFKCETH